jgi:NAD+ synthase (glutamine-hydrolysing)
MKLVRVAAATLNQTPLDWEGNAANILEAIQRAREQGVGILCLPELCITGYGCEDAFLAPNTARLALEVLNELLPATSGIVVSVGLPVRHNKAVYNTCALLADGRLLGFVAKHALAGDGIHYEPRWFKSWPLNERTELELGGKFYPLGEIHFDLSGVKIGFEICEDAWTVSRGGAALALHAVDVILNPSASHFAFGKQAIRRRLVLEGSRAFGVTYIYANLVGNEAGRAIYDGDAMIATRGALVAESRRFSYAKVDLCSATVDIELTRTDQAWLSSYTPEIAASPGQCVRAEFRFPEAPYERTAARGESGSELVAGLRPDNWERGSETREEELARAIPLALFDYLRKSRSNGFVVSLSGGADSAAVACFVWLMVELALGQLGADGLRARLAHIGGLDSCRSAHDFTEKLLTTVYQATGHSGAVTRAAARGVAGAIGARHFEFDVESIVAGYVGLIENALGHKLDWSKHDISLQNIQARARAPSAWLLANLSSSLLLTTSNRSEAAVGYATMDGDTAGSVSPIAGLDKAFLRRFLRWLEHHGPDGHAVPALAAVNAQAPTAELRPAGAGQTDEGDLMPYDVLDFVERAAIRDKRAPHEIFELLTAEFAGHAEADLLLWIERFYRLFSRNQWKRERYAPSFHLDDENLDPKTWCRFPILSGGFERELRELRAHVARKKG